MNEVKLKYNGDGTYTVLFVQGDRQVLFNKGIINIKACLDNDGYYGTVSKDPDLVAFEEKIAHIDKWDAIIEDANIIW